MKRKDLVKEIVMIEYAEKLETCINSSNLGSRHQCLIQVIEEIIPVLNNEIGEIGGGAIRETLDIQEKYKGKVSEELLPFSSENDGHNTYLNVVFGEIGDNDEKYRVGIVAETPWHGNWDFLGWSCLDSMPHDIRELSRDEVSLAAKRFCYALSILNEVYKEPEGVVDQIVKGLKASGLIEISD
ncbi:MAG: hypothetical protein ACYS3N_22945 [Planctomycetota bacterium]|jgi:hypothetical protein